jgi:hypothetical protein
MGLKGDIDEVGRAWPAYSWRMRLWLVLSVLLASNSIATLSDTIFRWKAFIKETLQYYEILIASPLRNAILSLLPGTQIPPGVPHFIVLSTLYLGASIRVALYALPRSRARTAALQAVTGYVGSCVALLLIWRWEGQVLDLETSLGLFIGSAACASVSFARIGGAARLLWFVYLAAPFAIVGVAAAVNSGLMRQQ